jgi:hypothetical protein
LARSAGWLTLGARGGELKMLLSTLELFRRSSLVGGTVAAVLLALVPRAEARVIKIIIDTRVSPAFDGQSFGDAGQYETIAGRAFGELDPKDPHNAIIQDIELATPLLNGKVGYMATFFLVKPIDMSRSSHLMWQDVPNRGGRITISTFDRNVFESIQSLFGLCPVEYRRNC